MVRAQVFQGLILASRDRFSREAPPGGYGGSVTDGAGYMGALWGHECGRVFCDKMNTPEDKAWVEGAIADLARRGVVTTTLLCTHASVRWPPMAPSIAAWRAAAFAWFYLVLDPSLCPDTQSAPPTAP